MLLIILHISQHDLGEDDLEDEHFKTIHRDDNVRISLGISLGYIRKL